MSLFGGTEIVGDVGLRIRGVTDDRSFRLGPGDLRPLSRAGREAGDAFSDEFSQSGRRGLGRFADRDGRRALTGREFSRMGSSAGDDYSDAFARQGRSRFAGIGRSLAGAMAGAFAAVGVGNLLKDAVGQASELEESASKVNVVFGDSAASVQRFAETSASAMGQSRASVLGAVGTFGNLLRSVGLTEEKSAEFSTSMATLASDLASFNNTSPEEALDALRSGLVGETEPLKRFGVNMNEAALQQEAMRLGLVKTKGPLDANAKAQAAYSLIMKQTSLAQGDFQRTSGGLANQQRILSATWQDMVGVVGTALLPTVTRAVSGFNGLFRGITGNVETMDQSARPKLELFGLGVRALVQSIRDPDVTSDGFIGVMERVGSSVRGAWDWTGRLIERLGGFQTVIQAVAAVLAGALIARIGFLGVAVAGVVSKIMVAVKTAGLMGAALAALGGPVTLVIVGIAALVAGLVFAYTRFEPFRNLVNDLAARFLTFLIPALTAARAFIVDQLIPAVVAFAQRIGGNLRPIIDALVSVFIAHVLPAMIGLRARIVEVMPVVLRLAGFLGQVIAVTVDLATKLLGFLIPIILRVAGPIFGGLIDVLGVVIGWVAKLVTAALDLIEAFGGMVAGVGRKLSGLQAAVAGPFRSVLTWVRDKFVNPLNSMLSKIGVSFRIPFPNIPTATGVGATGGTSNRARRRGGYTPPGWTLVGEEGPELVNFTEPSRVYTKLQTKGLLGDGPVKGGLLDKDGLIGRIVGAISDPAGAVRSLGASLLSSVPGGLAGVIAGAFGSKLVAGVIEKVKELVGSLFGGTFGRSGKWPRAVMGRVASNTAAAVAFVRDVFGIRNIGTLGNRPNRSDHPMGKALDAMIPNWRSAAGVALGNRIASWFVQNPGRFGTKYVIWNGQINTGGGWRPYQHPSGPTSNPTLLHKDHPHISLLSRGGVFSRPTLSMVSEYGQREAVVPLDKPARAREVMAQAGLGAGGVIVEQHNEFYGVTNPQIVAHRLARDVARTLDTGARGTLTAAGGEW